MKLLLGNVASKAIIGGKDNLLGINIEQTLREYLRVKVANAHRSPAYKARKKDGTRQWDGYRPFITKDLRFATGFVPSVCSYLEELGVQIEVIDERKNLPYLRDELITDIGGGWELRPYQGGIVKKVSKYITIAGKPIYFPRGVVDAATNAGKNSLIAGIYINLPPGTKALFTVHSADIYKQAVKFFSARFNVGEISGKKYKIGDFTIAMAKTLGNRVSASMNVAKDLQAMEVLFVDETHHAGGDDYARMLKEIGAGMRVLVSGTPLDNEDKIKNMLIVGLSGPVLAKVTNKFLIEEGHSLKPVIHVKLNNVWSQDYRSYDAEYEYCIQRSKTRFADTVYFIRERPDKKIVVAFEELAHGLWITRNLKKYLPELRVEIVHGADDERGEKIERYERGEIDVLVASTILQEGLNLPVMHGLVYWLGGKSKIRLKQFIGRAVRDDGESTHVDILDWFDIGKYAAKHSRARMKIYQHPDEGFDVKFYYPCRKNGTPTGLLV